MYLLYKPPKLIWSLEYTLMGFLYFYILCNAGNRSKVPYISDESVLRTETKRKKERKEAHLSSIIVISCSVHRDVSGFVRFFLVLTMNKFFNLTIYEKFIKIQYYLIIIKNIFRQNAAHKTGYVSQSGVCARLETS